MLKRLVILLFFAHGFARALPSEHEIIESIGGSEAANRSAEVILKVTKISNGQDSESKRFRVLHNDKGSSIVELMDPLDRGQKILSTDSDMWFLGSGSQRAIKVPPIQRAFGDASLGDIARPDLSNDYSVLEVREGTLDNAETFQVTLVARSKAATYSQIVLWIARRDFEPMQAHYFLASGKHGKSVAFFRNRRVGKSWQSDERILSDPKDSTRASRITIESVTPRSFPDSWFTPRHLEMAR